MLLHLDDRPDAVAAHPAIAHSSLLGRQDNQSPWLGGLVIEAKAQTPPSSPLPEKPPVQILEKVAPPLDSPGQQREINHKKFERDDGVIRPREDVDPDIRNICRQAGEV